MWNLFGHKNHKDMEEVEDKPDLNLLSEYCYECDFCHAIHSLINETPLSISVCEDCGASNFIPYLVKHYWLYKPLGGGGMGSVYKAIYYENEKWEFAVKVLPRKKKEDPELIKSLTNEAIIGKLFDGHPHIIGVSDYGKYHDEHFIAMEFCKGKRFDQIIELPDPVHQKYVLLWILQLLSAEQKIWNSGYIYRDVKPQNIIIDTKKNLRLYDFGLCLPIDQSYDPNSDTVEGSPLYMPPERIVGAPENMSSEIYSIGMLLFHALTRKTYYTASGAFELAKKHVTSLRTTSVSSKLPAYVHSSLAPIIDQMVQRIPSKRYQTFKEVAVDIKNVYKNL